MAHSKSQEASTPIPSAATLRLAMPEKQLSEFERSRWRATSRSRNR